MDPVSMDLNIATRALAAKLFPMGYDTQEAPLEPAGMLAYVDSRGRMIVWKGASDRTIYGDPEVNWDARAWHDWAHWRYRLGFDLAGETAAAFVQVRHLCSMYGDDVATVDMAALLLCEVIGQAQEFAIWGEFPVDQRHFALINVAAWQGLASTLVRALSKEGATDRTAIHLAKAWRPKQQFPLVA